MFNGVSMPSRAYTSFLPVYGYWFKPMKSTAVSMPSRAYTSFLPKNFSTVKMAITGCVNALTGLYLISTPCGNGHMYQLEKHVSMPSRAYTSFLPMISLLSRDLYLMCQCPHGLIPHFYSTPSKT